MTVWDATDPETPARAARIVTSGGVLLYPTATVYGLGCDPLASEALSRIRSAKDRDPAKPLLLLTDEWERMEGWVSEIGDLERRLMDRIPPLAVTLLLEVAGEALSEVRGEAEQIGVRATSDPFCRALIREAGTPIVSTSANPSGAPAPSRFEAVDSAILERVDGAVDAGGTLGGAPSTVVRIRDGRLEVLREGAVPEEELVRLLADPPTRDRR